MANYKEQIEAFGQIDPIDGLELRVQFILIGVCITAGWYFVGLTYLFPWFIAFYTVVGIEKYLLRKNPGNGSTSFFALILFINLMIGFIYSYLPARLWLSGVEAYQFVAMVLLVGSTLNTFVVRSHIWQGMICYIIPNAFVMFIATFSVYQESGIHGPFIPTVFVALAISVFQAVVTYSAYQSHQEHAATRERLIQSQKAEAIGNLAGGVAHDFNNLLNIISGNLELIRDSTDKESRNDFTAQALQAVERGAQLTERMLAYGRRSLLTPRPVDLDVAFVELKHMLERLLPSTIDLKIEASSKLPPVFVDENALHIAIINLCVNSRDAMPNGGTIHIRASLCSAEPKAFAIKNKKDMVRITITDDGIGIPKELVSTVTDPFVTSKASGSGLGLAMVNGFVDQSNGEMMIQSDPMTGTSISMALPISDIRPQRAPNTPRSQTDDQMHPHAQARILVVEDEPQLLSLLGVTFKKEGFELREAMNGVAALDIVTEGFIPDIVVTDVVMPGSIQGLELVRTLKERLPFTQFVVISGYAGQADNLNELSLDRVMFQQKPVRLKQLVSLVDTLLEDRPNI